jgi:hypothetical protein
MYDLVPTNELAMESINWPLTPKSQSLISPLELIRMLEGFTSKFMEGKTIIYHLNLFRFNQGLI